MTKEVSQEGGEQVPGHQWEMPIRRAPFPLGWKKGGRVHVSQQFWWSKIKPPLPLTKSEPHVFIYFCIYIIYKSSYLFAWAFSFILGHQLWSLIQLKVLVAWEPVFWSPCFVLFCKVSWWYGWSLSFGRPVMSLSEHICLCYMGSQIGLGMDHYEGVAHDCKTKWNKVRAT